MGAAAAAAGAAGVPGVADCADADADAVGEGWKVLENQAQEVLRELLPRRRRRHRRRHLQIPSHQQRNFSIYVSSLPI
jgi:hypothetical protein